MNIDTGKTVRELVLEQPGSVWVFRDLGIDYCCGGGKSLKEACESAGVSVDETVNSLARAGESREAQPARNWQAESLSSLIAHIVSKHHTFTREEIGRIDGLLTKVVSKHSANHPELIKVQQAFNELAADLSTHLLKEERILFPYITATEGAILEGQNAPAAAFGTVNNPVRMMMMEHDAAGELLRTMRRESRNYTPPEDACVSFKVLYQALEGLEQDLHEHIHLENNILFPRALRMEEEGIF